MKPIMEWPKDGKTMYFDDLVLPVRKAVIHLYGKKCPRPLGDIPWTGPPQGRKELVCCLEASEKLTKNHLDLEQNDHNRDALEVIIGIAIQLGIEQGRRMFKESSEWEGLMQKLETIKLMVKGL